MKYEELISNSTATEIQSNSFNSKSALPALLIIPKNIIHISERAFKKCGGIDTLIIDHPMKIDHNAFTECSIRTLIIKSNGLSNYDYECFNGCHITTVVIAGRIPCGLTTKINFKNNQHLEEVIISTDADISNFAFSGSSVHTLKINPDIVLNIHDCAFSATNIKSVELPTITNIGPHAFACCKKLKKVVCHDPSVNIMEFAFYKCKNLEKFIIKPNE